MTDLVITAANVVPGPGAIVDRSSNAGATVTAGQAVYREAASGLWKLADCNSGTAEAKTAGGIALSGASNGQPLAVLKGGPITIGGTLVAGSRYYLSATAGGIMPEADLTTGDNVCLLGLAASTTVLNVSIQTPGVTL